MQNSSMYVDISIYPVLFLYFLDSWLCSKFGDRVDPELGMPDKLKDITLEQCIQVQTRILYFRYELLDKKETELILTPDEINFLLAKTYLEYANLTVKDKKFRVLECFDIQGNNLIWEKIGFLCCFGRRILYDKILVKLTLNNGLVTETQKRFMVLNQIIHDSNYVSVKPYAETKIINLIFGVNPKVKSNNTIALISQKLKSIEIKDGLLILKT